MSRSTPFQHAGQDGANDVQGTPEVKVQQGIGHLALGVLGCCMLTSTCRTAGYQGMNDFEGKVQWELDMHQSFGVWKLDTSGGRVECMPVAMLAVYASYIGSGWQRRERKRVKSEDFGPCISNQLHRNVAWACLHCR